jgi:ABC-type spermidine/putrescine transport system permease subunit II
MIISLILLAWCLLGLVIAPFIFMVVFSLNAVNHIFGFEEPLAYQRSSSDSRLQRVLKVIVTILAGFLLSPFGSLLVYISGFCILW